MTASLKSLITGQSSSIRSIIRKKTKKRTLPCHAVEEAVFVAEEDSAVEEEDFAAEEDYVEEDFVEDSDVVTDTDTDRGDTGCGDIRIWDWPIHTITLRTTMATEGERFL